MLKRETTKRAALPLLLLLLPVLAGCAPWVVAAQDRQANVPVGEIYGPHTVGQSFVGRWGGLNGVEIFMATYARQNTHPLIFHLRESPDSTTDLATVTVSGSSIVDNAFQSFQFSPLSDSAGRRYYILLESPASEPGDAVTAWEGPADGYVDGALYLADTPQEGQLIFRLRYDPPSLILSLLRETVSALPWLLALAALLLLPGLALLAWLQPEEEGSWPWRIAVVPGLSTALAPVVLLAAHTAHLKLNTVAVIGVLALSAALVALRWRRRWPIPRKRRPISLPTLSLGVVVGLVIISRWLVARGLEVPFWGDSYHHTMLARLLVERGGLFQSWEPYAPLRSLTYHFGFHSVVALTHWLTGLPMTKAVILVGQALNVVAVLSLYPLAVRLTENRWAGVGTVLVAGLLSPMPQFYINWGRYTQLAGQAVLPVAILFTIDAVERGNRRGFLLAALSVAGLALTHYRVIFFYLCFLLAWLPFRLWARGSPRLPFRRTLAWLITVGVLSALIDLPWLVNLASSHLAKVYVRMATGKADALLRSGYNAIGDIRPYLPAGLMALLLLSVVWALVQQHQNASVLVVWIVLLLLLANPSLIGLPGSGVVNNFAVEIALYIPASLLIGYLFGELAAGAERWSRRSEYLIVTLLMALAIWGGQQRVLARDTAFQMVTRPDMEAMRWIRQNTPEDARFLINGFTAYGGTAVVGADAGWWIPLLAGRQNTIPPLVYGAERTIRPTMWKELLDFYHWLRKADLSDRRTARRLSAEGVTYIYIGQRQGRVGAGDTHPMRVSDLKANPALRPIYHQDQVWIFALAAPAQ
jgi:hypothetical protein